MLNRLFDQFVLTTIMSAVLLASSPLLAVETATESVTKSVPETVSKAQADAEKAMAELDEMMKNMEKMMFLMEAVQKDTSSDNADLKAAANEIAVAGEAKDDTAMNNALDIYVDLKVKDLDKEEANKWHDSLKAFKKMQEQAKEAEAGKK